MSFFDALASFAERPCLIDAKTQRVLSYAKLTKIADSLVEALPPKKQLVVIRTRNNLETIVGYLAFLRRNDAVMMLDASLGEEETKAIYERYRPNLIWEQESENQEALARFGANLLRSYSQEPVAMHPDLSLLLSTSGSTGTPKMVRLSRKNLLANTESILGYLPICPSDRAITNLPLHYSYGLSILHTHLATGAQIVVTDASVMSADFWDMMQSFEFSTLQGVPYHYEIFLRIGLMKKELPSLRYLTQAGGKLNAKLVERYVRWAQESGKEFYVMYGQTEATARMSYLPPQEALRKSGSIGKAIPNGKFELRDIKSGELINKPHCQGELIYYGPNVMLGYAQSKEDLKEPDKNQGVLHTGDLAYYDDEGFFYIVGRLKRFIKLFGNRVSLDDLEHQLKAKGFDVQCTGRGNLLMVATKEKECLEAIKREIIQSYGFHHSAVRVKYFPEYPTSKSGKIAYQKIMERFNEA
jgi:long-chain acyl-CoA synthetase